MSARIARRLVVHGRVQGVFFRESLSREAQRLGLAGWVRNLRDGTLEAAVEGTQQAVDALVNWAHRGPEDARVTSVDVSEDSGNYTGFEKRPTF